MHVNLAIMRPHNLMRIHNLFLILYKKHHVWKQRAFDQRNQEKIISERQQILFV